MIAGFCLVKCLVHMGGFLGGELCCYFDLWELLAYGMRETFFNVISWIPTREKSQLPYHLLCDIWKLTSLCSLPLTFIERETRWWIGQCKWLIGEVFHWELLCILPLRSEDFCYLLLLQAVPFLGDHTSIFPT